jgi:hypothetical protein
MSTRIRRRWLVTFCVLLFWVVCPTREARPTSAPAPGHAFPQGYLEYRKAHPEQFQIVGGLRTKVERARAERQQALPGGASAAGSTSASGGHAASPTATSAGVVSGTDIGPFQNLLEKGSIVGSAVGNTGRPPVGTTGRPSAFL